MIQETNFKVKGKFQMEEYEIFESIRQNKEKGGCLMGIHKSLKPVLIDEYSETLEIILTEIRIGDKEIRIITGYGPQEHWPDSEKMPFFGRLEEEISKAIMAGKSVILQLDANAKLGPCYIKDDKHNMSQNGVILSGIIKRYALIVTNGFNEKS